jgi:signal transduction histidine kinase
MNPAESRNLGLIIARARIALCVFVLLSVWVDPTTGGLFGIDAYMLTTLAVNLVYGIATYFAFARFPSTRTTLLRLTTALDVLFASVLTFFTEGPTSPGFSMFLFAIIATGCWANLRSRVVVTIGSVALYLLVIEVSGVNMSNPYLMRAVYLGIAGYLIDFFGRERDKIEKRLHELEMETERQKIARSLHDGFMQALAGISLRLETCRDMLLCDEGKDAFTEITEIQTGVALEYEEIRNYVRKLSRATEHPSASSSHTGNTLFRVETAFVARGPVVEHIVQIVLEGVRNTQQHGQARSAEIKIQKSGGVIRIDINDDGVGFRDSVTPPWTIASRVAEFGGRLVIKPGNSAGAHLEIELPAV